MKTLITMKIEDNLQQYTSGIILMFYSGLNFKR